MFHRATLSLRGVLPSGVLLPGARFALFAGAALLAGAISPARAASTEAGPERHGPPRPPPEQAFEACSERAEGDACSFEMHDHTLDGTCKPAPPTDGDGTSAKLACMPAPPAPPPEAVSACANLSDGDACTVQLADRSVQGVCSPKQDGALFCRPEHPPRD